MCDRAVFCRPVTLPESAPLEVRVRNISRAGVNLLVTRGFETGTLLSLELPGSTVLACVVQVAQDGSGQWCLACTFVNQLTDGDLAPFGARVERPAQPDRRRWVRFSCDLEVTYRIIKATEGESQRARVIDISASGVGLRSPKQVEAGALLTLELQGTTSMPPFNILACVVRTRQHEDGSWTLGCNFIRELQEGELQALIGIES